MITTLARLHCFTIPVAIAMAMTASPVLASEDAPPLAEARRSAVIAGQTLGKVQTSLNDLELGEGPSKFSSFKMTGF